MPYQNKHQVVTGLVVMSREQTTWLGIHISLGAISPQSRFCPTDKNDQTPEQSSCPVFRYLMAWVPSYFRWYFTVFKSNCFVFGNTWNAKHIGLGTISVYEPLNYCNHFKLNCVFLFLFPSWRFVFSVSLYF